MPFASDTSTKRSKILSLLGTKTPSPLVLLYRDIPQLPDAPHYDLLLTPQFYVSKRETLPIKYAFQAKKLAPSILDERTGEGTFVYEAFPQGDAWVFVAYDLSELTRFVESKGGSMDRVRRIYFAEQAHDQFATPVALDEREVLTVVNDTVTVVPRQLLGDGVTPVAFDPQMRPDKSFEIKHARNSLLDTRLAVVLAGLLAGLGLLYFVEGYRYQNAIDAAEAKLDTLLEANPSLRGAYARESIHRKYHAIDTRQRQMRARIKDISRLTGKDVRIDTLTLSQKDYNATLSVPTAPKTIASLKALAAEGKLEHLTIQDGTLKTQGAFQ